MGHHKVHTTENDTGANDVNDAQYSLMIFHDLDLIQSGYVVANAQTYSIPPTLLHCYNLTPPAGLRGKILPL